MDWVRVCGWILIAHAIINLFVFIACATATNINGEKAKKKRRIKWFLSTVLMFADIIGVTVMNSL